MDDTGNTLASEATQRIRILCVDDNDAQIELLKTIFETENDIDMVGYLNNTQTLLDKAEQIRPDIILMDLTIPGEDTMEAIRRMAVEFPTGRLIIFSGQTEPEIVDEVRKAGASGFVGKGKTWDILLRTIRQVSKGEQVFFS